MKRVAKFEKVSFSCFIDAYEDCFKDRKEYTSDMAMFAYQGIKIPKRATKGSAGYDFYSPIRVELKPRETIKLPTGIRVCMKPEYVLQCYPRSGLGFKYRLQLNNTVGIIDSDYYYSDNEGHIIVMITNDSNEHKTVVIEPGEAFMQGIFTEYGITIDDDTDGIRNGGFGSTNK